MELIKLSILVLIFAVIETKKQLLKTTIGGYTSELKSSTTSIDKVTPSKTKDGESDIPTTVTQWQFPGYSSRETASHGTNNSGYSNQQSVYSGSATTTTQGGTMISTSVSSSKLSYSLKHGVKDSSLLESQHSSSQIPESAVTFLDLSFGALQFGTDPSPFDFGTSAKSNNTYQEISQNTNGTSYVNSQSLSASNTSQSYLPSHVTMNKLFSYSIGSHSSPSQNSISSDLSQSHKVASQNTNGTSHVNSQSLPSSNTSQSYLTSPVTMSKLFSYSMGSHSSPSQNSISSDLSQSQKVASQDSMLLSQSEHKNVETVFSYVKHRTNQSSYLEGSMLSSKSDPLSALNSYNTASSQDPPSAYSYESSLAPSSSHSAGSLNSASADQQSKYQASQYVSPVPSYGILLSTSQSVTTSGNAYPSQTGYSSYGTNYSGYSNQQSVYIGSATTTTQGGTMISTSVSSSKLSYSIKHGVKDSSLLESQHSSSQMNFLKTVRKEMEDLQPQEENLKVTAERLQPVERDIRDLKGIIQILARDAQEREDETSTHQYEEAEFEQRMNFLKTVKKELQELQPQEENLKVTAERLQPVERDIRDLKGIIQILARDAQEREDETSTHQYEEAEFEQRMNFLKTVKKELQELQPQEENLKVTAERLQPVERDIRDLKGKIQILARDAQDHDPSTHQNEEAETDKTSE